VRLFSAPVTRLFGALTAAILAWRHAYEGQKFPQVTLP